MVPKHKKRIVVVGGGTGTHMVLRGLKAHAEYVDITAIVTMADSGGSTGRLRDEFGQLPVGDVRMALAALAPQVGERDDVLRQLLLYRFDKGVGLAGDNFGNLLLTALTDITGSSSLAIEAAARLLRIEGVVVPVTTDDVHLKAVYQNGEIVIGEHHIDVPPEHLHTQLITELSVTPKARLNAKAEAALLNADLVVFGPGDLYTSVLANCVVGGFKEAIERSSAHLVYVCNVMSRPGQTNGMHAAEHVAELERYIGRAPEHVIWNTTPLPEDMVERYAAQGTHPIENNIPKGTHFVHQHDLLAGEVEAPTATDSVVRSLLRHDSSSLARVLVTILESASPRFQK